ncbi:DUF2796 domain-containing protein [Pseudomonas sp. CrR25]|nr:DUF2796 domain-containing protein [Pseudomonas sp. CrR25]
MRRLLLTLPLTLLPLAIAQANQHDHSHDHADHGSLGAHEHGLARLNVVLDGQTLELELESPAMNLVGFEHEPGSAQDRAKVAAARHQLEQPQALFGLVGGDCGVKHLALQSPLFEDDDHDDGHGHDDASEHREIHAHYRLDCTQPSELEQLNLGELFKRFPATEKIQVQLIGPNGQQGVELTPAKATLSF